MVREKITCIVIAVLSSCLLAGCFFRLPTSEFKIDEIKGDIECEFRIGNNAQFSKNKVMTDTVFDKEEFIELFNLRESYNPNYLKYHLDECSLKIDSREKPGEFEKIDRSEINIKILYDGMEKDKYSSVSVFEYNSRLYFFVLCMGSRSKEDEIGYYYMELPEDMQEYWRPILEKVREDDRAAKEKDYGSFTIERTYTHDKKYYAECTVQNSGMVLIEISTNSNIRVSTFRPCRASDFWGISWEYDNYNLWIQSSDVGYICYSFNGTEWELNKDAVKPDYLIGRH